MVHFGDAALLGSMALDQTVGDLPSNTLFLDASNDEARFHLNASGLLTKFGRDLTLTYDGRSTNAFVSDGARG
ncbi:MAG: hypothetical protein IPJ65_39160 [Archangiaceae bacterium]|nr:hypothetical protein [Archangiaceae bacterium]